MITIWKTYRRPDPINLHENWLKHNIHESCLLLRSEIQCCLVCLCCDNYTVNSGFYFQYEALRGRKLVQKYSGHSFCLLIDSNPCKSKILLHTPFKFFRLIVFTINANKKPENKNNFSQVQFFLLFGPSTVLLTMSPPLSKLEYYRYAAILLYFV